MDKNRKRMDIKKYICIRWIPYEESSKWNSGKDNKNEQRGKRKTKERVKNSIRKIKFCKIQRNMLWNISRGNGKNYQKEKRRFNELYIK